MACPIGNEYLRNAAHEVVRQAMENSRIEHTIIRLGSLAGHYPPSPVVLNRIICADHELSEHVNEAVKVFHPPTMDEPMRNTMSCIDVMGVNDVAEITATLLLKQLFDEVFPGSGYLSHAMVKHCVGMAAAMRFIAKQTGLDQHQAYVCGLLSRIGVAVLAAASPTSYAKCVAVLPGSTSAIEDVERGGFQGVNHFDIGTTIAYEYEFPVWFSQCQAQETIPTPLRKIMMVSSRLVNRMNLDMGLANRLSEPNARDLQTIKFDPENMDDLHRDVEQSIDFFNCFSSQQG